MNEQFIKNLLEKLDNNVKLIGVSKTRTKDEIMLAHKLGITNFGENYVLIRRTVFRKRRSVNLMFR